MYHFVSEKTAYDNQSKIWVENAREVYEEILKTPSTSSKTCSLPTKASTKLKKAAKARVQRTPFDEKQFFIAAAGDDLRSLQKMDINLSNINQRDQFGWTALMMSACEGSIAAFQFLYEHGCDLKIQDKKGNSATSLARLKGRTKILDFIAKVENERVDAGDKCDENEVDASVTNTEFHCDVCSKTVRETEKTEHLASTLHRFNHKDSYKFTRRFGIPDSNKGFQMMIRNGWDREKGLGPEQQGHLYPVKTTIRKPRSGLGVKQTTKAKVTHFGPNDPCAIKANRPPILKSKTKRELKREQTKNQRKERFFRNLLS